MIDFKELEMADIEVNRGSANPVVEIAFSKFLGTRRKEEDEARALRKAWDNFEVVPSDPAPEEIRKANEYLKAHKAKEAGKKKSRTIPSSIAPAQKKAK